MECGYCGKKPEGGKRVSTYIEGALTAVYCSPECFIKACKRSSRILRKMSREQLLAIINKSISTEAKE
jgi:hypothetical protein